MSDEGACIHALNCFQLAYPGTPGLTFIDGDTLSFSLVAWIEDCTNHIVFDASELHQSAGTVQTFVGSSMDDLLGSNKRSAGDSCGEGIY